MVHDPTVTLGERESDELVAFVRCISGPDSGAEVVVDDAPRIVGSGPDADLQLSDRLVSRSHCELRREGEHLILRDLKSKNGTWHGKLRLRETVLAPGASFRVGESMIEARAETRRVRRTTWSGGDAFGSLVGVSTAMHRVFAMISRVAPSDAPVLISGESGTGKELVAREIHERGPNRTGPFVVVDAGAMSRSLADIEIFGHEKGAFTGADRARLGAFERADGGTLFLDEIGDLALDLQPKLLRALESGTVQRLGAGERRAVSVRVVAATHQPLREMVNEKTFREDLFYRLAVIEVAIPALRYRPDDVAVLAAKFLADLSATPSELEGQLSTALGKLAGHSWPGNVRELRSLVRRIAVLGGTELLEDATSDGKGTHAVRTDLDFSDAKSRWIEIFETEYLRRLLDETGGNVTAAAKRSGLNRSHLSKLVSKLKLRSVGERK